MEMYCEMCGKAMIEKKEEELLRILNKNNMDEVSGFTKQTFKAFRFTYDCNCSMRIEQLVHARNKKYYDEVKRKG